MNEEKYIHHQECVKSLNSAWVIACELETKSKHIKSNLIVYAAFCMMLIEYSKPFKKSIGKKGRHSLPKPSWLNKSESSLHDNIIRLRDTTLAHSDISIKETKIIYAEIPENPPMIVSNREGDWPKPSEVKSLIKTILDQLHLQNKAYEKELRDSPALSYGL